MIPHFSFLYFKNNYQIYFFDNKNHKNPIVAHKSYELRHKVYCDELNYESTNDLQKENDYFDSFSSGCLIYLKDNNQPIASVRLISNDIQNQILPSLDLIRKKSKTNYIHISNDLNGLKYGEISRLLILNDFRNQKNSIVHSNFLLLLLFASVIALAKDLDCIIFVCEKKLLTLFQKIGIPFHRLTEESIEHRGARYPIRINLSDVNLKLSQKEINPQLRTIYHFINYLKKQFSK
jgi:N-acyl-L-homoserine lactone synthetase